VPYSRVSFAVTSSDLAKHSMTSRGISATAELLFDSTVAGYVVNQYQRHYGLIRKRQDTETMYYPQ